MYGVVIKSTCRCKKQQAFISPFLKNGGRASPFNAHQYIFKLRIDKIDRGEYMAVKTETLTIKVSPEEKEIIKQLAEKADQTVSKYLYNKIFKEE